MPTSYRGDLLQFLDEFEFPEDARSALSAALERLLAADGAPEAIAAMRSDYAADCHIDFSVLIARADKLAKKSGILREDQP